MEMVSGCKLKLNSSDIEEIVNEFINKKMEDEGCELVRVEDHHSYPDSVVAHGIKNQK